MMKILRGIDSALLKIQNLILVFSTAIIILFMCTGVVMRYFFHANFHGLEELLLILGFWIYFFGGSVAFHDEDHMEASILQPRLKTQKSKDIYLIARNVLSLPTYYNNFWLEAQHPAGLLSVSCLSYNKGSNWLTNTSLGFHVRY